MSVAGIKIWAKTRFGRHPWHCLLAALFGAAAVQTSTWAEPYNAAAPSRLPACAASTTTDVAEPIIPRQHAQTVSLQTKAVPGSQAEADRKFAADLVQTAPALTSLVGEGPEQQSALRVRRVAASPTSTSSFAGPAGGAAAPDGPAGPIRLFPSDEEPTAPATLPIPEDPRQRRLTAAAPVQSTPGRTFPPAEDIQGRPMPDNGGPAPFDDDIKPLSATRTNIKPPSGEMPTDYARTQFGSDAVVIGGSLADRRPVDMVYFWDATALCYQPIYFDDVNLERYGYSHGVLEPFAGAIHFFGTIPILPYKMGMHPPRECVYALGFYRPGSPAPYQTSRLGWSWRGAVCEAAAIGAFMAWIPSGKFY